MRRRGNPFDVVARLRRIDERQARAALAHARAAHRAARERLEAHTLTHSQPLVPAEVLSPLELRSLQLRGLHSHEAVMAATEAAHRAQQRTDAATAEWRRASDELEAAERLAAKRHEESARRARLAAERSLDDLMTVLHGDGDR